MFHLKCIKKNRGALTVEAAISLPLFICVFLSIAFFMRVAYIQNNVQYAINGAANELSTYSYLYSISGLQAVNDEIVGKADEYGESASNNMNGLLEAFDAIGNSFGGKKRENIDAQDLLNDGKLVTGNVIDILDNVKNNPQKEFVSIAAIFAGAGYEKIKSELSTPMVRFFMGKYIKENIFNNKGGPGAYIVVNEGENPLKAFKFDNSIFADNKTIDIVVSYKIKTSLPINILPEIHINQRAIVRGWISGDGEVSLILEKSKSEGDDEEDSGSVWDLGNFEYGNYIKDKELEKYKSKSSENLYKVRSINLYSKTYQDIRKAKSSIRSTINKLHSQTMNNEAISSRTLIVVVPEEALTQEAKKMFEELKEEAANKEPPILIIEKEGYGKPEGY